MDEWKKIKGHFADAENYSHTSLSPNGSIWVSMFKTSTEVRLFAGFAGNYELPIIVVSCANDEKNFLKIQPLVQNAISCSPESAPFSLVPGGGKVNGRIPDFGAVYAKLMLWRLDKIRESRIQKECVAIVEDNEDKQMRKLKKYHRKSQSNGLFEHKEKPELSVALSEESQINFHEADETQEEVPLIIESNPIVESFISEESLNEEEEPQAETPPIANIKKLELSQEEYENLMFGIKTRNPTRSDIPYDLRLLVWNPPYDKKEQDTSRARKIGPARYTYRMTFGRFFKENMLDFKVILVCEGYPLGQKETMLLFDNELFKGNEAEVELPRTGSGEKKKMSADVTKVKLGSLLVETADLKVYSALGYTTVFTWDVVTIEMKGSRQDSNQNMYLVNMKSRWYKGQQDPAEQEENNL